MRNWITSLAPGMYCRTHHDSEFFEGLDSERGIAWRLADSLSLCGSFCPSDWTSTPIHVTNFAYRAADRRRRPISGSSPGCWNNWRRRTHQRQTIGVDSTTLEANAAMKSIVRRDTSRRHYDEYLKRLAKRRVWKPRTRRHCGAWTANAKRRHPTKTGRARATVEAEITKLKDGRTARPAQAENAVDAGDQSHHA